MSGPAPRAKVRCTYPDCSLFFNSVEEMKKHKKTYPEHDYCGRCNEDFEDEERLLIHKIKSNKHIVCPVCGIEFRSEGGRDAHIRQNHRAEQNLECFGCKAKFKSASGLMRHIEDDDCPEISKRRLLAEQSKKLIIKEALGVGEVSPLPIIPDPADLDDIDGGVKVSTLEFGNCEAMMNQPKQGEVDPTASVSGIMALKHWPQLSKVDHVAPEPSVSVLMAFPELSIDNKGENKSAWKGKGSVRSVVGSDNENSLRPFGIGIPDPGQTLRVLKQGWDATNFFNSFSGEYVCPCGARFKAMKEFEEHILMKSQAATRNMQCPGCLRIFKSTAALIAHCESPSTRCNINNGYKYGQIIDELSGGMIQAAGYNTDGTVKYEAGKLELQKTKKIGTNIKKVTW